MTFTVVSEDLEHSQPLTAIIIFCRPFVPSSLCGCGGAHDTFACCPSLKVSSFFFLSLSLSHFDFFAMAANQEPRRHPPGVDRLQAVQYFACVDGRAQRRKLQRGAPEYACFTAKCMGYGRSRLKHRWPTPRLASHDHERRDTLHRDTR